MIEQEDGTIGVHSDPPLSTWLLPPFCHPRACWLALFPVSTTEDLYGEILSLHNAIPRYNPKILPLDSRGPRYIRLSGEGSEDQTVQLALVGASLGPEAQQRLRLHFWEPEGEGEEAGGSAAAVTHLVVVDPTSPAGLSLAAAALRHEGGKGRVALLANPPSDPKQLTPLEQLVLGAAVGEVQAPRAALAAALEAAAALEEPAKASPEQVDAWLHGEADFSGSQQRLEAALPALAAAHAAFVRGGLRLAPGASAAVSNGRLVELEAGEALAQEDFGLMELYAGARAGWRAGLHGKAMPQGPGFGDKSKATAPGQLVSSLELPALPPPPRRCVRVRRAAPVQQGPGGHHGRRGGGGER